MKCVRCLAELSRQAQFCHMCGAPVSGAVLAPTGDTATFGSSRRRPGMPARVAAIIAAVVIAVGLGAYAVQSQLTRREAAAPPANMLVTRPGQSSGSTLVAANGVSSPSTVTESGAPSAPSAPVPADVMDYLDFLKKIEAMKKKLHHDEVTDLLVFKSMLPVDQLKQFLNFNEESGSGAEPPDKAPATHLAHSADEIAAQWNNLTAMFNERTPPESCRALHDAYYDHLGKVQGETLAVYNALEKVLNATSGSGDPSAVLKEVIGMQGMSSDVDAAMHKADSALADVCNAFHLKKDFDISEGPANTMVSAP